jgi:L-seryl-tRNA(Ser) seleniumtransferase
MGDDRSDPRRRLPAVARVLQDLKIRELVSRHGLASVTRHVRQILGEMRRSAERGHEGGLAEALDDLPAAIESRLEEDAQSSLQVVLNATGVIVHTNLGRAPLSEHVARRVAEAATRTTNLELDLESGGRGNRETHIESRLRGLLGSESSLVVNNCAAAVLLVVNSLAEGREVLVSRGELVEIGGSFRIPDVLRKGGSRLREVGTTNRTRIGDYRAAVGPDTALILRVHPSNYRIVGFTESPTLPELVALAREVGVPMV